MNRNRQEYERLKCYRNQLSPFGQKVLGILVEQWNSDCMPRSSSNCTRPRQNYALQKKVLNFRDSHSNAPAIASPVELLTKQSLRNLVIDEEQHLSIPKNGTSEELVRDDLLNTLDSNKKQNAHETLDVVTEAVSWPVERESLINQITIIESKRAESSQKTYGIHWNDMVDSELLPNFSPIQTEPAKIPSATQVCNKANKDILFNVDDSIKIEVEKKNTKRKNTTTLTQKKVKKLRADGKILRKERYTKTVNNWLNDINKNDLEQIDSNDSKGVIKQSLQTSEEVKNDNYKNEHDQENIIKEVSTKKKIVQTKLANKDGIMKYKVKASEEESNKNISVDKTDAPVKDDKREKKIKSKFVAPIKSQLPVKDIIYEILTVEDSNILEHLKYVDEAKDNAEVFAVLVHRNGFNQLNSIYTEEVCIPDGILLNIHKRFFFIKKFEGSIKDILVSIFNERTIVCYDGKIILIHLLNFFEFRPHAMVDLKIAGALLDPDNLPESFSDVQNILSFTPEYTISTDCPLQKAAWYSTNLKKCYLKAKDLLVANSMWKLFEEVEMPLVPIIADMERFGISVDLEKLNSMERVLLSRMKEVEQQCHVAAGKPFQINSPLQVRALLYDELKLDELSRVRVKETATTGAKSTSETALRNLIPLHPLPRLILQYRHLHKAHATFVAGIAAHVRDGVVRPSWLQIASATGRVAASNPNLQAIPKKPFNLDVFAEEDNGEESLNFRSVYVSRAGHALLAADFRHVECRVWAASADDASLAAALAHTDMFRALAAQWLNKSEECVSAAERERTKRVVYAGLYGCGPARLADILAAPYQQALDILASFNRRFPSLRSFGAAVGARAGRGGGRLNTAGGRSRSFPALESTRQDERARAHRQAVNYVVQGSAADVCKVAMRRACAALGGAAGAGAGAGAGGARLLLQLHDELLWEVRRDLLPWAADVVKKAMEESGEECGLGVRLPVAAAAGDSWGHMLPM